MAVEILKFSAEWCTPCKMLAKSIDSLGIGDQFKEIDIDKQQDVAAQYGIRSIPTLVAIKDGSEVGRKNGFVPPAQLKQWVESLH